MPTRRRHPWLYRLAWLRRNRCSLLLLWLCLLILANPAFGDTAAGHKRLGVALMVILLLAAWALRLSRRGMGGGPGLAGAPARLRRDHPGDAEGAQLVRDGAGAGGDVCRLPGGAARHPLRPQPSALASAMPDTLLPRDGLVIVAKRDCPTCVLVEPVIQS